MSPETQILRTANEVDRILRAATGDLARQIRKYRRKHGMVKEFEAVKPMLRKQLIEIRRDLHEKIVKAIEKGQVSMWDIANRENDIAVKAYARGKGVTGPLMTSMMQANLHALEAFLQRKEAGLGLSGRVWRMTQKMMGRVETYLGAGITTGKSSARIATDLKRYLNKPDALFRRVRGPDGKLRLSKAAKEYHPGQGVYRSAFKNAHRLARTETNMAYRSADFERRQQQPFVVGIEVHANPDACDMCQAMKGDYPKEFIFDGFHPQCRCWTTEKLCDDEAFAKYLETGHMDQRIYNRSIPQKAQGWIDTHKDRLLATKEKLEANGGYSYWMSNFDKSMQIKPEIGVHTVADPETGK